MPPNPFNPGVFHAEQLLFGREGQLLVAERVVAQIEGGYPHAPVCFIGPPGLGKTAILKYLAADLRRRNWLCGYSEAGSDIGSAIYDLLADAEQIAPDKGRVRRLLSRTNEVNVSVGPAAFGLGLDSIKNGTIYTRLVELFRNLSSSARFELVGAALFLDEAQALPSGHLDILLRALSAVADSAVVLFMAALPNLMDNITPGSRSVPHISRSELDPLDAASAHQALVRPAQQAGGEFTQEALSCLMQFANGHPLVIQLLGQDTWNVAAAEVSDEDFVVMGKAHAALAVSNVTSQLEFSHYRPTWRSLEAPQQELMKTLAHDGEAISETELIRSVSHGAAQRRAESALDALIGNGIVTRNEQGVYLVMPGFREFINKL